MKYNKETYQEVINDIKPLLIKHWREVALHKDKIPFDPDWDLYKAMDKSKRLIIFTCRSTNMDLVGYNIYFLSYHAHYKSTFMASNDILYLKKEYRGSTIGYKLLKYSEEELKSLGVDLVLSHIKPDHNYSSLLLKMGYNLHEYIYSKYIGD